MPSVESLCELLEAVADGPGLPPDALYAQLNPWVAKDSDSGDERATLLASLSALAYKPNPLLSHLASLAMGYLGGKDGFYALVRLISDSDLPATHRENAADALSKHFADQLEPHSFEFETCMLLQTQRVLRLVAEGHVDARAILSSIIENTTEPLGLRGALEPLLHATKMAELPLAAVWGDFAAAQTDPDLRRDLINLIASDRQPESAQFLAALETQTKNPAERKELRKHLHVLKGHGVKVPLKAGKPRSPAAIVFGVDGDACASIFLFVPEEMGGSLISFVIHLTGGLRDGFVRSGLGWSEIEKEKRRFVEEAELAGAIPFAEAVHIIGDALARTPAGVLRSADVSSAVAHLRPYLSAKADVGYPTPSEGASEKAILELLNSPAFGYWFFEAVEDTMAPVLDFLGDAQAIETEKQLGRSLTERFKLATERFLAALVATGERERVSAMLFHQGLVLNAAGKRRHAALCVRLAEDLQSGDDAFLRSMASRSLLWAMESADERGDEWERRYNQCHEGLRQVLQDEATDVFKNTIAKLDLAAQIATAIIMRNRRLPSSVRAGLHSVESAALEMAELFLIKNDDAKSVTPIDFEAILNANQIMPEAERQLLGKQALEATVQFVQRRCNTCRHQCLKFPGGPADGLLFAQAMPWEVPVEAVARRASKLKTGEPSRYSN